MATTTDYLNQLKTDKSTLKTNLETKGITGLSESDTFTSLVPKVLDIQSGGDLSDYFNDTLTQNTSSTTNWASRFIKKLPSINITNKVTSLSYCFNVYPNSSITFNNIDTSNVTNFDYLFYGSNLTSLDITKFNFAKATNISAMFGNCANLTNVTTNTIDTSKVTSIQRLYYLTSKLETLPITTFTGAIQNMSDAFNGVFSTNKVDEVELTFSNLSNASNISYAFKYMYAKKIKVNVGQSPTSTSCTCAEMFSCYYNEDVDLESLDLSFVSATSSTRSCYGWFGGSSGMINLKFGTNLGAGYSTSLSANNNYASLNLSNCNNLSHDSLVDVISKLYDLANNGKNSQKLILGSTNLAKLTSDEIAVATAKGWNVS